jgi:hypothetical protein
MSYILVLFVPIYSGAPLATVPVEFPSSAVWESVEKEEKLPCRPASRPAGSPACRPPSTSASA